MMLSGEMKRVFAQSLAAQKEGLAALERSRGETAALRSLANAARMIEENPSLLQLRALQTMESSKGNTLVLNVGEQLLINGQNKKNLNRARMQVHQGLGCTLMDGAPGIGIRLSR